MNTTVTPSPSPGRQQLVEHLKSVKGSIGYEQRIQGLHSTLLSNLTNTLSFGGQIDPVLSCVLAELNGSEINNIIRFNAISTLMQRYDDYQVILGNLLPNWLVEDTRREYSAKAFDNGTNDTLAEDLDEYLHRLETSQPHGIFSTGLPPVDEAMGGGVHGLTILLGDKGVGKTALSVNCALSALQADPSVAVLFYSLDINKRKLIDRIASSLIGVPTVELAGETIRGQIASESSPSIWRRIRIRERDFGWVSDQSGDTTVRRGLTALTIEKDAASLLRQPGVDRVLIIIDLFQKMVLPSSVSPSESDQYRLDAIDEAGQKLRRLRGNHCVAFLAISEMRKREAARRNALPTRDDIKGDGRIPSDADNVLILAPSRDISQDEAELILRIDKGRDGVVRGDHKLRFLHRVNRFLAVDGVDGGSAPLNDQMDHDSDPFE